MPNVLIIHRWTLYASYKHDRLIEKTEGELQMLPVQTAHHLQIARR
jgi:hypothetical protein